VRDFGTRGRRFQDKREICFVHGPILPEELELYKSQLMSL
jgi:hypothetical protein